MISIPRDQTFDNTFAMIGDSYEFILKRCRQLGSDVFETRLLLRKTICMTGPDAAELFCDHRRFIRRHAAPSRVQATLSVQVAYKGSTIPRIVTASRCLCRS